MKLGENVNAKQARLSVFMHFLENLAQLSKCTDKKNAAILCDEALTQVYSIGLNGGPKRGLNCLCTLGGKYTCVHAEAQALMKAPSPEHGPTWPMLLCTMSPCVTCASMIINYGVHKVVYMHDYKDATGIKLMLEADREVYKYDAEEKVLYKLQLDVDGSVIRPPVPGVRCSPL